MKTVTPEAIPPNDKWENGYWSGTVVEKEWRGPRKRPTTERRKTQTAKPDSSARPFVVQSLSQSAR